MIQTLKIERYVGLYGEYSDTHGVISDDLEALESAGGVIEGSLAYFPGEEVRVRILCSELIEIIPTCGESEAEPIIGRCGIPVVDGGPWCSRHQVVATEDMGKACEHGMSACLCAGPGHYPMDR